jgi:hypothetical protein
MLAELSYAERLQVLGHDLPFPPIFCEMDRHPHTEQLSKQAATSMLQLQLQLVA